MKNLQFEDNKPDGLLPNRLKKRWSNFSRLIFILSLSLCVFFLYVFFFSPFQVTFADGADNATDVLKEKETMAVDARDTEEWKEYIETYVRNEEKNKEIKSNEIEAIEDISLSKTVVNGEQGVGFAEGKIQKETRTIVPVEGKKYIALTFDDGPSKHTSYLLDELDKRNTLATFFILSDNVRKQPDAFKKVAESKHEVESHTFSHSNLVDLTEKEIKEEFDKTANIFFEYGLTVKYLRPPYGAVNSKVNKAIKDNKLTKCLWTVDPLDWKSRDAEIVSKYIIETVKDRDIVLLHDTHLTSVEAALKVIDTLSQNGYEFITVDEMFLLNSNYKNKN
ncbi:MAG: polysaccharide deacetylase family protein [Lachnospirales bacterium]